MFTEDEFIHINLLQHYAFCPRQCALIYLENIWDENLFTVRGNILHEKVDSDVDEDRDNLKIVRGLRIHSYRYGLVGKCDVVEIRYERVTTNMRICASEDKKGITILPVEYKAGKPKSSNIDKIQLCAQVLCLEEMLQTQITTGAFFYGAIRRRVYIAIDEQLRIETAKVIKEVHDLLSANVVPHERYSPKCRNCSIINLCQPKAMNEKRLKEYTELLYKQ